MYQPKQGSSRPLSQQDLDAHFAALPGAQASAGATMEKVIDDYRRKYPNGTPKVSKRKPGPVMREALQMAEALRRARRADVGEANGIHKLEPFTTYG